MTAFLVLLPVFLTATVMPLTYSIANGIGVGFITWALLSVLSGRGQKAHWLLWAVSIGFILYFVRGPITALIGG